MSTLTTAVVLIGGVVLSAMADGEKLMASVGDKVVVVQDREGRQEVDTDAPAKDAATIPRRARSQERGDGHRCDSSFQVPVRKSGEVKVRADPSDLKAEASKEGSGQGIRTNADKCAQYLATGNVGLGSKQITDAKTECAATIAKVTDTVEKAKKEGGALRDKVVAAEKRGETAADVDLDESDVKKAGVSDDDLKAAKACKDKIKAGRAKVAQGVRDLGNSWQATCGDASFERKCVRVSEKRVCLKVENGVAEADNAAKEVEVVKDAFKAKLANCADTMDVAECAKNKPKLENAEVEKDADEPKEPAKDVNGERRRDAKACIKLPEAEPEAKDTEADDASEKEHEMTDGAGGDGKTEGGDDDDDNKPEGTKVEGEKPEGTKDGRPEGTHADGSRPTEGTRDGSRPTEGTRAEGSRPTEGTRSGSGSGKGKRQATMGVAEATVTMLSTPVAGTPTCKDVTIKTVPVPAGVPLVQTRTTFDDPTLLDRITFVQNAAPSLAVASSLVVGLAALLFV